ncbi:DNA repair protein RecO [Fibrobacter sp. UWB5]|uniref:DNA repair protein RecO n=1 Tax=Fibrobacter sp. UWB5 TaxID=1964360 RepID=UPI000B521DA2|nr:DNA repair protein RecO [Fibrobacter sp. UWB5]OWV14338.1 DNA repair protein RecO [Fibrobacter sp. UWB5]
MIKTRAIVLHRFAYSDSSFIVKALTEECGVVSFIIKGAKRKESPFKGALDPLALSEVVFRQNPNAELQFIKEASIIDWHSELRNSLLNLAVAQVMAEIVLRYAPPATPIPEEFALLKQALAEFDSPTGTTSDSAVTPANTSADSVFSRWLLNICDLWGYHLELGVCSRCEKVLTEPAADFFPESGALICKHCQGVQSARARAETLQGLWELNLAQNNPEQAPQKLTGRVFVENALLSYLRNHIGFLKEIHSLSWLQEVRKLCSAPST